MSVWMGGEEGRGTNVVSKQLWRGVCQQARWNTWTCEPTMTRLKDKLKADFSQISIVKQHVTNSGKSVCELRSLLLLADYFIWERKVVFPFIKIDYRLAPSLPAFHNCNLWITCLNLPVSVTFNPKLHSTGFHILYQKRHPPRLLRHRV